MRRLVVALLLAAVLVGACGNSGSDSTSDLKAAPLQPVLFEVSVHVEGWRREDQVEDIFDTHAAGILQLATVAADHEAALTFEFSQVFLDAVATWESDILDRLDGLGHALAIHADVGGRGVPSLEQLVVPLRTMRRQLSNLGYQTTHASGVCSRGPWVEAVLAAGYHTSNGGVAYCGTSMNPTLLTDDQLWLMDCESPQACHGPAPLDDERRMRPFFVQASSDWMVSEATDGLLLVVSESGSTLPCLDGAAQPGSGDCLFDPDDATALAGVVEEYLDGRTLGRHSVLSYSWSIGSIPRVEPVEQLLDAIDVYVAAGQVRWATAHDIGHLLG
ncbi:MAG: hypothetical protein P8N02_02385 [Actinomycetota bacterium]|nr:hypothetical protein [Actinomycetota bacterium]